MRGSVLGEDWHLLAVMVSAGKNALDPGSCISLLILFFRAELSFQCTEHSVMVMYSCSSMTGGEERTGGCWVNGERPRPGDRQRRPAGP